MLAAALYGVLLMVVFELFAKFPQPIGSITMWGLFAAQLTWVAVICWRRTGLLYATAAMAVGAGMFACLTLLAATGQRFPNLPLGWWIVVWCAAASGPILFFMESKKNEAQWREWATIHGEEDSLGRSNGTAYSAIARSSGLIRAVA